MGWEQREQLDDVVGRVNGSSECREDELTLGAREPFRLTEPHNLVANVKARDAHRLVPIRLVTAEEIVRVGGAKPFDALSIHCQVAHLCLPVRAYHTAAKLTIEEGLTGRSKVGVRKVVLFVPCDELDKVQGIVDEAGANVPFAIACRNRKLNLVDKGIVKSICTAFNHHSATFARAFESTAGRGMT